MTIETEVVDIVDKLAKFPIGDWEEARLEIVKLRSQLASYATAPESTPEVYGVPSGDAPTQETETVTYPDGTQVTGVGPLPNLSPITADPNAPTLQDVMDGLHGQIATLSSMHEEATAKVSELQDKCTDLETQLALSKNAPEEAASNIEKHPAVTSLRAQVSSLRSDIMEKTLATAKALSELTHATVSKNATEAELESTNNANASLQARLDATEKSHAAEKARADALQEQVKNTNSPTHTPFTLKNIFFKNNR